MIEETGVPGENHRPVASNLQRYILLIQDVIRSHWFTDTRCHVITKTHWFTDTGCQVITLIYWYKMSCDHKDTLIYWYRMSCDHIDLLIQDVMWSHWFTVKFKLNSILDKPLIVNLSQLMWHVMCLISVIQVKVSVIRSDHYYPM